MKNILITFSVLLAGVSVFYYYVIFLPQQQIKNQQDINAIRNVVAPTPEQQRLQQQQSAQRQAQSQKDWTDYNNCLITSSKKQSDYLNKICNFDSMNNDYIKWSDCSAKVRNTIEYKQLGCTMPTNF